MLVRACTALALLASCGRIGFGVRGGDGGFDTPAGTTVRSQLALPIDPVETLADFPLAVVLDDQRAARDLMLADASDLRFFDSTGHLLAHEIEQVGAAGGAPLVAWVRVPEISGSATKIAVSYGDTPVPASAESVWTSGYKAVWHLADDKDATMNRNDGTWTGAVEFTAAGLVGPAHFFGGQSSADAIEVPDQPSLDLGSQFTIAGWIDPSAYSSASGFTSIVAREAVIGMGGQNDFYLGVDLLDGYTQTGFEDPSGTPNFVNIGPIPNLDTWTHVALTYDGTNITQYRDAIQILQKLANGTAAHSPLPIILGADCNGGGPACTSNADSDFIEGGLDEIRLETVARSQAWLTYDVASMRDALITYGAVTR